MNDRKDLLHYKEIGCRIRYERELLGLSREKFAEIIGLSPFYIGQIERGDRKMSMNTVASISNSLKISLDYILNGQAIYMENIAVWETFDNLCKEDFDEEIKDLLAILKRCSKVQLTLIKDITDRKSVV